MFSVCAFHNLKYVCTRFLCQQQTLKKLSDHIPQHAPQKLPEKLPNNKKIKQPPEKQNNKEQTYTSFRGNKKSRWSEIEYSKM